MTEDKPIITCTVDEVINRFAEKFAALMGGDDNPSPQKNLVYGLAGLSRLLGCSVSTAARIKKSGVLAPAIHQTGKIIVIDADLALDLMKVRKRCR